MNISIGDPKPAGVAFGMRRPSSLVLSPSELEAADFLESSARKLEPLAAVAGVVGIGKTTALNEALARLEQAGRRVLRISNFVAGPLNLHRTICALLGVERTNELTADEIAPALHKALADGGYVDPPVLSVDDAQSLLPETLEYLSMMSGLREAGRPSFCILLVGRPGFTRLRSFPLHLTMQPAQTGDAARIVRRNLASIGASAPELIIQELVADAAGNLRTLDSVLQARIEQGRSGGITRGGAARGRRASATPSLAAPVDLPIARRPPRRSVFSGLGLWGAALAVPVLMGVGAAVFLHHKQLPPDLHETAPAPVPVPEPPQASSPQPAVPPAAVPNAPAPQPDAQPQPQPQPQPDVPQDSSPAPTKAAPAPPAATAQQPEPAPATAPTETVSPPVATTAAPPEALTHFRVYNIGPCPNRVCRRWAVADLDHDKRFVAGFDAASLKLDPDLAAKARLGAVELTVSGTLVTNASGGKQVVATELESVAPHHSRSQPASGQSTTTPTVTPPAAAPNQPPTNSAVPGGWSNALQPSQAGTAPGPGTTEQAPAVPAPSQPIERSPPPGFLRLPAGEAGSSPAPVPQPQAIPQPVPSQAPQRNGSDNWMSEPVGQAPLPAPVPPPASTGPN